MKKIKITAVRQTVYSDLISEYENPLDNPCSMKVGQTFIVEDCKRPTDFCESAWETLLPFIRELALGGSKIYGNWMKNQHSAMLSCNDGFRPMSFYVEVVEGVEI